MSLLELSTHAVRRKIYALNWQTEGFNRNHVVLNQPRLSSSLNDSDLSVLVADYLLKLGSAPARHRHQSPTLSHIKSSECN